MAFRHTLPLAPTLTALLFFSLPAQSDDWPAPIQALGAQGLEIHAEFEAPAGLTGYGASYPSGEVAIYLLPDGEHAIVGTLVDVEGNDLSAAALDEHVRAAQYAEVWQQLEESYWILDGDRDAPRIVYTFTDPNCPYCRQFWQAARPWVEAGQVQLRHVMVGVLQPDSPAKAAALLGADDPQAAFERHNAGEEVVAAAQPREIEDRIFRNNQLFEDLGFIATPTTLFQLNGRVDRVAGMPSDEQMMGVMGGPAP